MAVKEGKRIQVEGRPLRLLVCAFVLDLVCTNFCTFSNCLLPNKKLKELIPKKKTKKKKPQGVDFLILANPLSSLVLFHGCLPTRGQYGQDAGCAFCKLRPCADPAWHRISPLLE